MLNVYFWKKTEKMLEIDLHSDLKEEPDLKSRCCFTLLWTGNVRILNISESQCGQIYLDMFTFVNMPEYAWNITYLNKPEF